MTTTHKSSRKAVSRPTKAVKRSRQGCANCRLRKVKCDELKPTCERCKIYGVFCNYDSSQKSDLQLSAEGVANFQLVKKVASSLNIITLPPISPLTMPNSDAFLKRNEFYQLRDQDLELLRKFQTRTVYTITFYKSLPIYQNEIIKLACASPFLMHAVLALTMMHDRYLGVGPFKRQSPIEASHWSRSIALYNDRLSKPVLPSERDALWGTAALLGVMSFAFIDAETPEEAWPLAAPSSLDLNWLKLSDGKKEIWNIVQPFRSDCVFQPLALEFTTFLPTPKGPGIETLPAQFLSLFDLDATSTSDNNPCYDAASILARSLNVDCEFTSTTNFFAFLRQMSPDFKQLLERKDPRALLLLAYFYTQVCHYRHWWLRRTMFECQAICIYLERNYQHELEIQELLQFPKMGCRGGSVF